MRALRPWTWSRTALRRGFQGLVALSVLPLVPMTWAWLTSAAHRVTAEPGKRWTAEVPAMPAALVLGAGVQGDNPSAMLRARLDIAAELYRTGRVRALLLSGDNSRRDYDEPSVMRGYLVSRGVPAERIVLDYAGFDTWDSCVRAKTIFGASRLVVVTQVFHLPRAVALCRAAGLDAFGVGDDSSRDWPIETVAYAVREFPASAKGMLDGLVLHSSPRFLGRRETALDRAVAR
ncbi:SanA/YdcF family protein [Microbispora siamensis]|uniref:Membrane protein n=1 Tax=Microbispora siamensis TaxID=564413 RepID=A0ABQ4GVS6_9ACTN|nr:ElyC/SanA/YdcF family protein [Microbispora siamensis]GIH65525.1 membrane protein [Microbispora siamensis]